MHSDGDKIEKLRKFGKLQNMTHLTDKFSGEHFPKKANGQQNCFSGYFIGFCGKDHIQMQDQRKWFPTPSLAFSKGGGSENDTPVSNLTIQRRIFFVLCTGSSKTSMLIEIIKKNLHCYMFVYHFDFESLFFCTNHLVIFCWNIWQLLDPVFVQDKTEIITFWRKWVGLGQFMDLSSLAPWGKLRKYWVISGL